ncbi:MAG: hypothetical protein Kow0065_17860 [Methylomicrobium sp.]
MLRKDHDFIRLAISGEHLQNIRQRLKQYQDERLALQQSLKEEEINGQNTAKKPLLEKLLPLRKNKRT